MNKAKNNIVIGGIGLFLVSCGGGEATTENADLTALISKRDSFTA